MSDNKIYEIARMINNSSPLNEDVVNALEVLRNNFQNNYVRRLVHAAGSEKAKTHPSREVVLLKALKSFGDKNSMRNIDRAIEMLTTFQAINNVQYTLNTLKQNQTSIQMKSSLAKNHPADIISPSSINIAGLLLTMELLKSM